MENLNQTEQMMSDEDVAMQEAEAVRSEAVERRVASQDRKSVIPLAIVHWLAANAPKYHDGTGTGSLNTPTEAAQHPDVRQLQRDLPSLSLDAATRIAWLLWRARQVEFWTMDLHADRVTKVQGGADVVRRGVPTHTWEECLDAAYLGKTSELHCMAFDRRERFYAVQNAQRDELKSIALTLGAQPGPTAEKAEELRRVARDSGPERVERQQAARAARVAEERQEATKAVQPKRRQAGKK